MNVHMAHGGASVFSLELVPWRSYSWPLLVRSLSGLRVLRLSFPVLASGVDIPVFSWSLVPSGVVELSIQLESLSSLNLTCDEMISSSLTSLHIDRVSRDSIGFDTVWYDRFPNLETLSIRIGFSSPVVLPRHLTSLRARFIYPH